MIDLENYCPQLLRERGVNERFFFRYVDDTFFCVHERDIQTVLEIFNSFYKKLVFTHEIKSTKGLSFLDIIFIIFEGKLTYNWYTKPRFLNSHSAHPKSLKINMIYYLVNRAIGLSLPLYYVENLKKVRTLLSIIKYLKKFFEKHIAIRLKYHRLKFRNFLPARENRQKMSTITVP